MPSARRRAAFLDRDGTLNVEVNYLHRVADLVLIPGVGPAVARLNQAGWAVVVITNQAGIARGFYDADAVATLHDAINARIADDGAHLDAVYFCPHHPEFSGACPCRKPAPGLLHTAARELNLDLKNSWLVGDTLGDLGAAAAAGCRSILVATGHGHASAARLGELGPAAQPAAVVPDLAAAVAVILAG